MASVNRSKKIEVFNHEGVAVPAITPLQELRRSVMSCLLWEDEFYEQGEQIAQRISRLVTSCAAPEVAAIAIEAKASMRLRHTPLFLARELCRTKEGRKQLEKLIPELITRPDDITEMLAIYLKDKKHRAPAKLPNQLKKHLAKTFQKFDEYQLAKYNRPGKSVSLKDAMKMLHPKATSPEQLALWGRLIKDELKTPDTWEVELSANKDKKAAWTRLLTENKLGGLAMLRNIRNMTKAEIDADLIKSGINSINAGRLLPINFISAATHNPQFESEIEKKFFECFDKRQKIAGKTLVLVDISPSMNARLSSKSELTRMDVGFSLAMIAREMFSDVRIFSFATRRVEVPARHGFGLRDAIRNSQPSNGTLLGKALTGLPEHDRLIVLTDEESQDPVPQMKGYMVNVASTQHGIGYHQWTHIDGWSDKVLDFLIAHEAAV